MLKIQGVIFPNGEVLDIDLPLEENRKVDGSGLVALPALVDPHVHFRVPPGYEDVEDWVSGAKAAIAGGITTVFDMPNNLPSCTTYRNLLRKKELIDQQLAIAQIKLNYKLYFGADRNHVDEIPKIANFDFISGIKIFMGSSTGSLLVDDLPTLSEIFQAAKEHNLIVSVHAEDEKTIREKKAEFFETNNPADHSKIRCREAAIIATEKAIALAKKYGTKLAILHLSTKEEIALIRSAKSEGVSVFAEVVPHHLFLDESAYEQLGTLAQVNPPLRTPEDCAALWEAIIDGTIDWIGTDHAPHSKKKKNLGFGNAPSGIASIELLLPLLLNACYKKQLSLHKLIDLTSSHVRKIFSLPASKDLVLVDLNQTLEVTDEILQTKCGFSPYRGRVLKGVPKYTILNGQLYDIGSLRCQKQLV